MRNELRFLSNALVYFVDKSNREIEASVRDLSEHGLAISSDDFINIEPNSSFVVAVIPEKETQVGKFQLEVESKWVKLNRLKMESGFSVVVNFGEKEFKDYLDYLSQKSKIDPESAARAAALRQLSGAAGLKSAGSSSPLEPAAEMDLSPGDGEKR